MNKEKYIIFTPETKGELLQLQEGVKEGLYEYRKKVYVKRFKMKKTKCENCEYRNAEAEQKKVWDDIAKVGPPKNNCGTMEENIDENGDFNP